MTNKIEEEIKEDIENINEDKEDITKITYDKFLLESIAIDGKENNASCFKEKSFPIVLTFSIYFYYYTYLSNI